MHIGKALVALSLLTACDTPGQRLETAHAAAREGGLSPTRVAGPTPLLAARRLTAPGQPVRVYVEGDGQAWLTRRRPSSDPTPRDPVGLRLAAADPGPNVVWIGRPCQYGGAAACDPALWTGARFSEAVVEATTAAIDQLVPRGAALELVGWSGGGAVAALVAARRGDVASLRTAAGNLDHAAFTRLHGVTPLDGSLNPADAAERLADLPQLHFVGLEDEVVPPAVAESYARRVGACARLVRLDGVGHQSGWAEAWPRLLAEPPACPVRRRNGR